MADPTVSIIIPAWNSHQTVAACLDSLRAQTFRDFEVILVDSSPGAETHEIVLRDYPEVRYVPSACRLLPHAARNVGAGLARGAVLVFTDPDCRMSPQWLERLVAVQTSGRPAAGGSVESLGQRWFERGVHLAKYAWWLPGGTAGPRSDLPSANASYARELFDAAGAYPEGWCGDTLLNLRILNRGLAVWFDPLAVVYHDHRTDWRHFLTERYERGYDYGVVRPVEEGWGRARTLAYGMAAPLIAAWMTARAARYATASGHLGQLLCCFPVVAMGYAARCAGEAAAHWRVAWRRC
jgi:glycosyltransferase involved in cell wall biosynthesis